MFEDSTKRLQALQEQMDKGTVKETVVGPLGEMIQGTQLQLYSLPYAKMSGMMATCYDESDLVSFFGPSLALSTRSFTQSQAIHAKMMQTEFDSEGKWLLGFKRLMDLYATTTPPPS